LGGQWVLRLEDPENVRSDVMDWIRLTVRIWHEGFESRERLDFEKLELQSFHRHLLDIEARRLKYIALNPVGERFKLALELIDDDRLELSYFLTDKLFLVRIVGKCQIANESLKDIKFQVLNICYSQREL
jgi:hypothetical protein